jgi:hypothetical protein
LERARAILADQMRAAQAHKSNGSTAP